MPINTLLLEYIKEFDSAFDPSVLNDPDQTMRYVKNCLLGTKIMQPTRMGASALSNMTHWEESAPLVPYEQIALFRKIIMDKVIWEDEWEDVNDMLEIFNSPNRRECSRLVTVKFLTIEDGEDIVGEIEIDSC